jgi:hypothetical protein
MIIVFWDSTHPLLDKNDAGSFLDRTAYGTESTFR